MIKTVVTAAFSFAVLTSPVLAKSSNNLSAIATKVAHREGVNPAFVKAIIQVETRGRCHMTGSAGEQGAMQVKPATARSVGVHGNLYNCETGITAGARYAKLALRLNHGNICAAATSYNAGIGRTGRCSNYGRKVVAFMGHPHYASLR